MTHVSAATMRDARLVDALMDATPDGIDSHSRQLDPRLHAYQVRAVRHLWDHPRSALFLDMGL